MRPARRLASIALLSAAGLILSGCVPADPEVTPPAEPSSEAIFASDEEALAAATDAYEAYLKMSDLIAQEGGKNPERIAPLVSQDALPDQIQQFAPYQERSIRASGSSRFDSITLQQFMEIDQGVFEIVVYLCLDVTAVKVLDDSGKDVTPGTRASRLPLEIGFEGESTSKNLVITRSESWHGSDFC